MVSLRSRQESGSSSLCHPCVVHSSKSIPLCGPRIRNIDAVSNDVGRCHIDSPAFLELQATADHLTPAQTAEFTNAFQEKADPAVFPRDLGHSDGDLIISTSHLGAVLNSLGMRMNPEQAEWPPTSQSTMCLREFLSLMASKIERRNALAYKFCTVFRSVLNHFSSCWNPAKKLAQQHTSFFWGVHVSSCSSGFVLYPCLQSPWVILKLSEIWTSSFGGSAVSPRFGSAVLVDQKFLYRFQKSYVPFSKKFCIVFKKVL